MREVRYMISDTAKKVDVEAHVLRYWEEELELDIARNEMGHRYYTNDDILLFRDIKELKEQGFQLKAIKMLLPELKKRDRQSLERLLQLKEELNDRAEELDAVHAESKMAGRLKPVSEAEVHREVAVTKEGTSIVETKAVPMNESGSAAVHMSRAGDKMQQFQEIIGNIVTKALQANNKSLGMEVSNQVSDSVLKEMDYLLRLKDEREEERYKRLDETIRCYQRNRQEIAAAEEKERNTKKKKGFIGRKRKYSSDLL